MKILVHSGIWCGDCVDQCQPIQRIAEANPAKIDPRFLGTRDEFGTERRTAHQWRKPGSDSSVFLRRWFMVRHGSGPNTQSISCARVEEARSKLPNRTVPSKKGEVEVTLADWLNEAERVQLMLRLTPRLYEKHQD